MQQRESDDRDRPVTALTFGEQFLDALGLGGKGEFTTRLQLTVEANELVTLTMTRYMTERQGLALCRLLTGRFDMVQRGNWDEQLIKPGGNEPDRGRL